MSGALSMNVHLEGDYEDASLALLKKLSSSRVRFDGGSESQVLVSGVVPGELAASFPGLKHIVIPYAGVPAVTLETARSIPGITLHNLHHNAVAAAEMALSLMMAAVKQIIPADSALRKGDWSPRYVPSGKLIEDCRVLVLGWGSIGRRIGDACSAMGASVTGIRRTASKDCRGVDELLSLLPAADILFVCLPMTGQTRGLIGEEELALMPRGSHLINVARGAVVDEEALFRSLSSGHLGGAGLDVWYSYPRDEQQRSCTPPSRFDFGSLPNVVMSPHRGGAFGLEELERRRMEHLARLLNALADGNCSRERVDLQAGY